MPIVLVAVPSIQLWHKNYNFIFFNIILNKYKIVIILFYELYKYMFIKIYNRIYKIKFLFYPIVVYT
jgi:hypothetical protein